jgi:hypothetical protein
LATIVNVGMSDDDPGMPRQLRQGRSIGDIYALLERQPGDRSIHGSCIYVEIA